MKFELAENSLDHSLREIMRNTIMPGRVAVAYEREPDFFHGLGIQGKFNQTIAAIENNNVIGFGCRSVKPTYINHQIFQTGYLSSLRSLISAKRKSGLARGFRFFKKLHGDGLTKGYLTTIIEENDIAKNVLAAKRKTMPIYLDMGKYITYAVNLKPSSRKEKNNDFTIVSGNETNRNEILHFLSEKGRNKQFFPVLEGKDFDNGYLRGLSIDDFLLAVKNDKIIGVISKWDQHEFKQNRIMEYSTSINMLRHFNPLLKLSGLKQLPKPGECINMFYAAFACVKDNDPVVFEALLNKLYNLYCKYEYNYFLIGLHERDSLNIVLNKFHNIRYCSRLYWVCWEDGKDFFNTIDKSLTPFMEVATL